MWDIADHLVFCVQLLASIGEQFTEGDEICGIVVNVRAKQDKLCVWTKTASNEAAQVSFSWLSWLPIKKQCPNDICTRCC